MIEVDGVTILQCKIKLLYEIVMIDDILVRATVSFYRTNVKKYPMNTQKENRPREIPVESTWCSHGKYKKYPTCTDARTFLTAYKIRFSMFDPSFAFRFL